jgi:hypothetical protein
LALIYGNIGAADRLDFTVIGPAVNLVSRVEAVAKALNLPIVVSHEFARAYGGPLRSLGTHQLRGLTATHELFAPAIHPPQQDGALAEESRPETGGISLGETPPSPLNEKGNVMSFRIRGLPADHFNRLFTLSDEELAEHHAVRRIADDRRPGYPCRVSLTDSEPGDELLLVNYEHLPVDSPYRSALPSLSVRATRPTTKSTGCPSSCANAPWRYEPSTAGA